MSGSVRQFEKSRAEIPDAASPKRLHQNPQHQPQQPSRKRESPGQATSPLSATNKHRGAKRRRTKLPKSHIASPQGSSPLPKGHSHSRGSSPWEQRPATGKAPQQQCPQQESQSPTPDNEEPSPSKGRKQNPPIATKPLPRPIHAHRIPID